MKNYNPTKILLITSDFHLSMARIKSMGKEYQITAEGSWDQVVKACRITEIVIKDTQQKVSSGYSNKIINQNSVLKSYLIPKEGETFTDYKNRVIKRDLGTGIKGKLVSFLIGDQIPLQFYSIKNNGESTLRVESTTRERKYQATISASGDYSKRGDSIATGLKEALEQNSIQHSYKTIDKLI